MRSYTMLRGRLEEDKRKIHRTGERPDELLILARSSPVIDWIGSAGPMANRSG
jgi:hypothetical protein